MSCTRTQKIEYYNEPYSEMKEDITGGNERNIVQNNTDLEKMIFFTPYKIMTFESSKVLNTKYQLLKDKEVFYI